MCGSKFLGRLKEIVDKDDGLDVEPEYDRDEPRDAAMRRWDRHLELLTKRGGFSGDDAMLAIIDEQPETKEPVARWLRAELGKLRKGEQTPGQSPVRRGQAIETDKGAHAARCDRR